MKMTKSFLTTMALTSLAFASSASASTVGDILERNEQFTTLNSVLQMAGLSEALQGEDQLTVLAPVNKAFEQVAPETLDTLLNDTELLTSVLTYHVIEGRVDLFSALREREAATLNAQEVTFTIRNLGFLVNDARIMFPNVGASNGIIHVIDSVLVPNLPDPEPAPVEKSIAEIAAGDERFSTLVTALEATDLVDVLAGEGEFTVFAPTNEAFAALGEETVSALLEDTEALKNILLYHIVQGTVVDATTAAGLGQAEMANGDVLKIEKDGASLMVGNAKVIITDIKATNGIIHVIDTVLVP